MKLEWKTIENEIKNIKKINLEDEAKVIIFGAGLNGREVLDDISKKTIKNHLLFWDNFSHLDKIEEVDVVCPALKSEEDIPLVIIGSAARNYKIISKQLEDMGCLYLTYFNYIFMDKAELFKKVYEEYLSDDISKELYLKLILSKLKMDMSLVENDCVGDQYFALPQFAFLQSNDVLVDCGAYVGDVIETYIEKSLGTFKKIYAFEPGKKEYHAMEIRVERLSKEWAIDEDKIILEQKACGIKSEELFLYTPNSVGTSASLTSNKSENQTVSVVSLDDYFKNNVNDITFLKADVEGTELALLKGAKNILKKYKPRLAICLYHKQKDYIEIPLYIKSIVPEYHMYIRKHRMNYDEVVLYCNI